MKNYKNFLNESKGIPDYLIKLLKDIDLKIGLNIINLDPFIPLTITVNINFSFNLQNSCDGNINFLEILSKGFDKTIININQKAKTFDVIKAKETLNHELIHLYELFKINKIINTDWQKVYYITNFKLENTNVGVFNYFLDLIYISFDHEIRARVAQLYDSLIISKDSDLHNTLKNTYSYQKYTELLKFNIYTFIKYYKDRNELVLLIDFVNILNKKFNSNQIINNEHDLLKYFQKWNFHFKDSANKYYKKMIKILNKVKLDKEKDIVIENLCCNSSPIKQPIFFKLSDVDFIMNRINSLLNL